MKDLEDVMVQSYGFPDGSGGDKKEEFERMKGKTFKAVLRDGVHPNSLIRSALVPRSMLKDVSHISSEER